MRGYTTEEINQRFDLLEQYERRCIIHFLQEAEPVHASTSDVVSHLQKQDSMPDERDKLKVVLHHHHLPKLATIDAFDFDSHSETVQYDGDELLEALLEPIPETHVPSIWKTSIRSCTPCYFRLAPHIGYIPIQIDSLSGRTPVVGVLN